MQATSIWQYPGYWGFRILVGLFRLMPFGLMYALSALLAWILHRLIRYRRQIVLGNLTRSFPEKSPEEIQQILKGFYRHLADITLEGIKGLTMSKEQVLRRYRFANPEFVNAFYEKNQHVFAMPAHYGNWEWGVLSFPLQIKHRVIGIYKPIRHPLIGTFTDRCRTRFGLQLEPIQTTRHAMLNPPAEPTLFIMMSDQSPSNAYKAHWLTFLNQDTACLYGADKWARQLNYPVLFMDIQRIRRGFYEIRFSALHTHPEDTPEQTITRLYMEKLEAVIRKKPADWLWSHRRWKKKKPTAPPPPLSKAPLHPR